MNRRKRIKEGLRQISKNITPTTNQYSAGIRFSQEISRYRTKKKYYSPPKAIKLIKKRKILAQSLISEVAV